jgi:thiosulfate/3-mercaptopyruvate sulfurtransferase
VFSLALIALLAGAPAGAAARPAVAESLLVGPAWLKAHLGDPDLVILDFRMPKAEYDKGHIPGAQFIDRDPWRNARGAPVRSVASLDSTFEALGISDSTRVVIYGNTWIAPRVFLALDYIGHGGRTAMLDGGLPAWEAAGYEASTEVPATRPRGHLTPRSAPDFVVDAAWIEQHRTDKRVALLDGRSQGEFTGADKSEKLPRSGHIPGAINLPWELTYTSGPPTLDGNPSPLRPAAELRKLLTDAGITPDRQLVAYCTVGMRAAHWYFVARYLGLEPKFYDGSMRDWSPRSELPVVEGN